MRPETIGGEQILKEHNGSAIMVAEAFILGDIKSFEEPAALDVIDKITLETARIRLEAKGLLNKKYIKDPSS